MKKVLVLNISTDSKNTSLGFAISWLNAFAKKFDEVHVISLSKGSDDELEKNVTVYSVDNELGRISKIINLYKLINKLTKSNKYEFCLSHMSSLMVIISSPILKIRKIKKIKIPINIWNISTPNMPLFQTDKNISEKFSINSIIKFYITKTPLLQD